MSTVHALMVMFNTWLEELDEENCVWVLFIGFEKTFDWAEHRIILNKMVEYGVSELVTRL